MTNIYPVNWNFALLRQNPFPNTPPRRPEDAVWAGFPRLMNQFNTLFIESVTTSATQIVLNRGAWGSGKTHSAVYFSIQDRLPTVEGQQVSDTIILSVRTPKEAAQADIILYQNIIEAIKFSRFRVRVRELIKQHGKQKALELLQEAAHSESLGKIIWLLGLEKNANKQLQLFEEEQPLEEWHRVLEACFFSNASARDLRELGLGRGITSSQDRFRVLAAVLQCLIGFAPIEDVRAHQRVILWVDEMEDLLSFTKRYHRPFTQGLRDLIDYLPHYFTLLMNFTLAVPEEWEDITITLGGALMSRVNHQIYFQEPNEEEAFEYVCELLNKPKFRTENPESLNLPLTYPFTEQTLRKIILDLHSITPRDLNQRFSSIVSQSLQQGIITGPGQGIITNEFVSKFDESQIEFDLGY